MGVILALYWFCAGVLSWSGAGVRSLLREYRKLCAVFRAALLWRIVRMQRFWLRVCELHQRTVSIFRCQTARSLRLLMHVRYPRSLLILCRHPFMSWCLCTFCCGIGNSALHKELYAFLTLNTNPMNRNLPEKKQENRASHATLGIIMLIKLFCCFWPMLRVHSIKWNLYEEIFSPNWGTRRKLSAAHAKTFLPLHYKYAISLFSCLRFSAS
jgi:hypothetical protein